MCCLPSLSMGPEITAGDKLKAKMKASSTYEANPTFDKELENECRNFASRAVDQTEKVNITEATNSGVEAQEYLDATESSSSFDDCDDSEPLYRHGDDDFDLNFGFDDAFRLRKKDLTNDWRSYVQPLRWRCKWVELQIKKLEEQGRMYDVQLGKYSQQKQAWLEKSALEQGLGVKSIPFYQNHGGKNEVRKRKKRRRAEKTKDLLPYISHHNIFSYYVSKKGSDRGAFVEGELRNREANQKVATDVGFWGDDQSLCIENGNDDNSLEQILRKIVFLQSRVGKLKSRVEKVKSETDVKTAEKVISENVGELAEKVVSENNGKLPEKVITEKNGKLPEKVITGNNEKLPERVITERNGKLSEKVITGNNGKLPERVITEKNGKLPEKVNSEKVGKSSSSDISDNDLISSPLNRGRNMSMADAIAYQLIQGYIIDHPELGIDSQGDSFHDANGNINDDILASIFPNEEEEEEDLLIDNHRAMEVMRNYEELIQPVQKSPVLAKPDFPRDNQMPKRKRDIEEDVDAIEKSKSKRGRIVKAGPK
ncbi:hypothetical protein ABFX02_14G153100 [Erythranthe guttata]|uniref:uncharacterized protein LOC105952469 isoform X1 n=1 Tax=Erythranthe guttata TaxID=4155 RepID=UPI00064DF276|nr:PREDICTED: uncharacterized protein LOC105952469 isoform X1 [Erythranthe guttata]|eukprot:XP_012831482.1 PREDICTED: uncharacterized protein LOC105952469 isoform X1 [Erythranthe guttata]